MEQAFLHLCAMRLRIFVMDLEKDTFGQGQATEQKLRRQQPNARPMTLPVNRGRWHQRTLIRRVASGSASPMAVAQSELHA